MNQLRRAVISLIFPATFAALLAGGSTSVAAQSLPETLRAGRSIQLDGFLIDWKERLRQPWAGAAGWYHDAAATPEGVAGYFTGPAKAGAAWTIYIAAQGLSRKPWRIEALRTDSAGSWYRTRQSPAGGGTDVTV